MFTSSLNETHHVCKDLGRINRFPAQSLSISSGFCINLYSLSVAFSVKFNICKMQQHGGHLLMLHTLSKNQCQSGRGSYFFKKIFCQKTHFLPKIIKKIQQYAYCNLHFGPEVIYA